jgi:membrane protein implicated in regulation of membrane protease activity
MDWWMWLAGGVVLLLIELATPSGFFVMFFGLGALTTGALARLELLDAAWAEWLTFSTSSLVYLLLFRGQLQGKVDKAPAEVDTLVGELAIPRERIQPGAVGRVDLRGTLWTARNEASSPVEPGQRCRVTRVDNLLVSVQPE